MSINLRKSALKMYTPDICLQIYDGSGDRIPAGTLWTSNSSMPVYSSTGYSLYVVFKTGAIDKKNRNLGFVANVSFVSGKFSLIIPLLLKLSPGIK